MSDNLTFEDLSKTRNLIFPPLYYVTMDNYNWKWGTICHVAAGPRNPEYILFHPLDFDEINQSVSNSRRLVHLRDYKPTARED